MPSCIRHFYSISSASTALTVFLLRRAYNYGTRRAMGLQRISKAGRFGGSEPRGRAVREEGRLLAHVGRDRGQLEGVVVVVLRVRREVAAALEVRAYSHTQARIAVLDCRPTTVTHRSASRDRTDSRYQTYLVKAERVRPPKRHGA